VSVARVGHVAISQFVLGMGAGKISKQQQEHNILAHLKGKKISIIPDNDEPGKKHAQAIAELIYDLASEVKIINLPVSKSGGDVSDYLDEFKDPDEAAERLTMLMEQAAPYQPSLSPTEMARVSNVTSLLNMKIKKNRADGKIGEDTGFRFMQRAIHGFVKTFLYIVGAYTSVGKTAIMIQFIVGAIEKNPNIRMAVFSTEMACIHILLRLLANWTAIPSLSIFKGNLGPEDDQCIQRAYRHFSNKNLWLFDNLYSVDGIERACEQIGNLDVVFIDFLQNLHGDGGIYERMSLIPLELQEMAKKQNTCIVAMSQVSNESVKSSSPVIGFKGAGEIAAACDLGLWLERDQSEKEILKCYIRKNRHGATGKITLKYVNNFTGIEEVTI